MQKKKRILQSERKSLYKSIVAKYLQNWGNNANELNLLQSTTMETLLKFSSVWKLIALRALPFLIRY